MGNRELTLLNDNILEMIIVKIGDLNLHYFIIIERNFTVEKVLHLLNKKNLDYGILKNDDQIYCYITRQMIEHVDPTLPVKQCLRNFSKIISSDTLVKELEKFNQTLKEVFLLYNKPGHFIGILDFITVVRSLQHLNEQNVNISEELYTLKGIIDFSSEEIYVTDNKGNTLIVNKAYEENSGICKDDVLGKNVLDLEKKGFFKPSVTRMVLEQKKQVSIFQEYANKSKVVVTGTPIFNKDGSVFRVIVNAHDTAKINRLKVQLEEIESLKERYYQELVGLGRDFPEEGNIIAYSNAMARVLNLARKVAEVDSTVLLLGETGVGKGLLARYIHDNSTRRKNLFVAINCGAIPENLLESELFGYEPGAFTGAYSKGKVGKIEMANGGTVFLDEIGDLPQALQVKLLHILHEGTITRVGGTKEIALDVRFIAATNRDLARMVQEGLFREDLYYRLNVVPVEIPPLRERRADIVPLVQNILNTFNQKYKKNKVISPAAMSCFQCYSWPGNVRELENIIERFTIVINEDIIEPFHLPETIRMGDVLIQELNNVSLAGVKKEIEKKILEKLYKKYKSTYKIAEILKINQSTVARKIKKYNIRKG
jgi:TyrR family helix-turn-helix protein/PAS domain S-box-containing protein